MTKNFKILISRRFDFSTKTSQILHQKLDTILTTFGRENSNILKNKHLLIIFSHMSVFGIQPVYKPNALLALETLNAQWFAYPLQKMEAIT